MKLKILFIGLCVLLGFTETSEPTLNRGFRLLTPKKEYTAGSKILLEFMGLGKKPRSLILSSALGTIALEPESKADPYSYNIPKFVTENTGVIFWHVQDTDLAGNLKILPQKQAVKMESYLGPTRLNPDSRDKAMFVNTSLDPFDNPITDQSSRYSYMTNTVVFSTTQDQLSLATFDYLPQLKDKRKILASASGDGVSSKEFQVDYTAGFPVEFSLSRKRDKNRTQNPDQSPSMAINYADGNQVLEINTSTIRDQYGNIVDDGTRVEFYAQRPDRTTLKSIGTTINGVAIGHFLHPETAMKWQITAEVPHHTRSASIGVFFESALQDFNIKYDTNHRIIKIGPLTSFMDQLHPDGLVVVFNFKHAGKQLNLKKESQNGFVILNLDKENISGATSVTIIAAGIEKTIKITP